MADNLKIYLDTSIIGGCFDEIFEQHSNLLIKAIEVGKYQAYISKITIDELEVAPEFIRAWLYEIKNLFIVLPLTENAKNLAAKYILEGGFSPRTMADMTQIAIATINELDMIVSWNFKHIVNSNRIIVYNNINEKNGYKPIMINSPKTLIHE